MGLSATGVREVFSQVPHTYERTNHILTLGLDILWRRSASKCAATTASPGAWLDVCTGTGETAVLLNRFAGNGTRVTGIDFCEAMLAKAATKPEARGIRFVNADARDLPFESRSMELVTISFALRNLNVNRDALLRCLGEFRRVLKPGGRLVSVETTQSPSRIVRSITRLYIRLAVRRVGGAVTGSQAAYAYLAHTIPRFYGAPELARLLREAGFSSVRFRYITLGIVAVHEAVT